MNDDTKRDASADVASGPATNVGRSPAVESTPDTAGLEGLMQRRKGDLEKEQLAKRAAAAAEEALAAGRQALAEATDAAAAAARPAVGPTARGARDADPQRRWLLRGLLAFNVVAMVAMIVLPGRPDEVRRVPTIGSGSVVEADPGLGTSTLADTWRPPGLGLPDDESYTRALLAARDGDYAGAVSSLRRYLDAFPDLADHERRLIYGHIAYYLRKDGRAVEAVRYETEYSRLVDTSSHPRDLLQIAAEAEARGDGPEMRKAWARLLLQEEMLPPTLRAVVTEAYLKLGDAYRVEAEATGPETPAAPARSEGR